MKLFKYGVWQWKALSLPPTTAYLLWHLTFFDTPSTNICYDSGVDTKHCLISPSSVCHLPTVIVLSSITWSSEKSRFMIAESNSSDCIHLRVLLLIAFISVSSPQMRQNLSDESFAGIIEQCTGNTLNHPGRNYPLSCAFGYSCTVPSNKSSDMLSHPPRQSLVRGKRVLQQSELPSIANFPAIGMGPKRRNPVKRNERKLWPFQRKGIAFSKLTSVLES